MHVFITCCYIYCNIVIRSECLSMYHVAVLYAMHAMSFTMAMLYVMHMSCLICKQCFTGQYNYTCSRLCNVSAQVTYTSNRYTSIISIRKVC